MVEINHLKKLESMIYAFSVNILSFVKSLSDKNIASQNEKDLLNSANELYSLYLDILKNIEKGNNNPDIKDCILKSEKCASLIKNFELSGILLNEKVDLAIEANEILRLLRQI